MKLDISMKDNFIDKKFPFGRLSRPTDNLHKPKSFTNDFFINVLAILNSTFLRSKNQFEGNHPLTSLLPSTARTSSTGLDQAHCSVW
jgi:hypothetical protein